MRNLATLFLTSILGCLTAEAEPVPIPIEQVQTFRFDEMSQTSVIEALVIYRDGCYRPVSQAIAVQYRVGQVYLYHYAEREDLNCTMALRPKVISFSIGQQIAGESVFVDGVTGKRVPVTWK